MFTSGQGSFSVLFMATDLHTFWLICPLENIYVCNNNLNLVNLYSFDDKAPLKKLKGEDNITVYIQYHWPLLFSLIPEKKRYILLLFQYWVVEQITSLKQQSRKVGRKGRYLAKQDAYLWNKLVPEWRGIIHSSLCDSSSQRLLEILVLGGGVLSVLFSHWFSLSRS